jgi:hypothetical protein
MFEGMDIPWVSKLNPIKRPKPEPPQHPDSDLAEFGPAALEVLTRIIAKALEPFPEAARAIAEALRANYRALVHAGLAAAITPTKTTTTNLVPWPVPTR